MAEKKELKVEAKELAKDPAVDIVEVVEVAEVSDETAKAKYGELPKEVLESGIGVGYTTGFDNGVEEAEFTGMSTGLAGEEDFRGKTVQRKSQD